MKIQKGTQKYIVNHKRLAGGNKVEVLHQGRLGGILGLSTQRPFTLTDSRILERDKSGPRGQWEKWGRR